MRGLAAMSAPTCWGRDVSRSLVADSGLACAECGLRHAVLRETGEKPFKRPLSNLVVHFRSSLFLEDCGRELAGG